MTDTKDPKPTRVKTKWYRHTWLSIVALVLFAPLGIFMIWKFGKWRKLTRIIVTAVAFGWFVIMSIALYNSPPVISVDNVQNSRITTADSIYMLSGSATSVKGGMELTINGKQVNVSHNDYKVPIELKEGDNVVTLVAKRDDSTTKEVIIIHRYTAAELLAQKKAAEAKLAALSATERAKKLAADKAAAAKKEAAAKAAAAKKAAADKAAAAKKAAADKKAAEQKAAAEAEKAANAPKEVATFTASLGNKLVINPATLQFTATVNNTSNVASTFSCFVNVSDTSGTYKGYDIFGDDQFLAAHASRTFTGNLTITKEGAYWVTQGSISCTP